jgi:hypothetical protein
VTREKKEDLEDLRLDNTLRLRQVERLLEAFATRSDSIHESTAGLNSRGNGARRGGGCSNARQQESSIRQFEVDGGLPPSRGKIGPRTGFEEWPCSARRQLKGPIQPETARPISSGESS